MDKDTRFIIKKVVFDFICLCLVAFPIILFFLFGKPYKRGFFCDDESLRHPFHESTVTETTLYIVGLFLPVAAMTAVECCRHHYKKQRFLVDGELIVRPYNVFGYKINPWVWEAYKAIGVFGFGAACSQLTTDIGKYTIGRLRPHFFAVCQPNVNCSSFANPHTYIEDFTCLGGNPKLLKEVRLSFPSGHSSFSSYTMTYLAIYLQARLTTRNSKLFRHILQYICLAMAFSCAMSRISDYKHHWSDVLAGSFLGITVAVLNALFVSDLFERRSHECKSPSAVTPLVGNGVEVELGENTSNRSAVQTA
ncbi:putative phosphatidate phosphatase [Hetaerina americana]|uniref:putative phosphatidate phosphatase n=1 Tax=Hetaerina americana TaxID=62018 RepID=UPI003A7F31DE